MIEDYEPVIKGTLNTYRDFVSHGASPDISPNLLLRQRISPHLKAFSCPATSEGSNTLSPAGLRKSYDMQRSTPSRYEVCEITGPVGVRGD